VGPDTRWAPISYLHDADGVPRAGRLVRMLPALIDGLRGAGYTLAPLRDLR